MLNILFVCHGNICRSIMAECIMKYEISKRGIKNINVDSKALTWEEDGNPIYYLARQTLKRHNIPVVEHFANRYLKTDYKKYDLIYYMDSENKRLLDFIKEDLDNKYKSLQPYEIEDPWYTDNFEKVYEEIYDGINKILSECIHIS